MGRYCVHSLQVYVPFNAILVKIPAEFFEETDKLILKQMNM